MGLRVNPYQEEHWQVVVVELMMMYVVMVWNKQVSDWEQSVSVVQVVVMVWQVFLGYTMNYFCLERYDCWCFLLFHLHVSMYHLLFKFPQRESCNNQ
jgi:hypothetical protein